MEDITGLIIYLILAIIGVLAGIYRSKNKHKSVLPPPGQSSTVEVDTEESYEREYDPFAGIFEERAGEEDLTAEVNPAEEEPAAEYDIDKEKVIIEQDIKNEETYIEGYEEGAAVFEETDEVLISDDESEITDSQISDTELIESTSIKEDQESGATEYDKSAEMKERFDVRKAIIYSEILKRREY